MALLKELGSQPGAEPRSALRPVFIDHYSRLYQREKSDSPEFSRVSLMRRAQPIISKLSPDDIVLDLGSGRQAFEKQYITAYGFPACKIITTDIADISKRQLLLGKTPNISHVRADGAQLPFANNSIALVVSNMAFDFMPEAVIREVRRVLKPDGRLLVNFHHPTLIPDDLDEQIRKSKKSDDRLTRFRVWRHLRDYQILFSNSQEIVETFQRSGFEIESAKEGTDQEDIWWEVNMQKAA